MSLSSVLLSKKAPIDAELDTLFKLPVAKAPISGPSKEPSVKKRKLEKEELSIDAPPKRSKASPKDPLPTSSLIDGNANKKVSKPKRVGNTEQPSKESRVKGKGKEVVSDSDEDDQELENAYLNGKPAPIQGPKSNEASSDDEEDSTQLIHESLSKKNKKVRASKTKHVPQEETPELRDQRTVFVGNLPIELASKKPLQKQLKRHILSFLPTAKIESIRFRSIPFQAPTVKPATSDDEGGNSKPKVVAQPGTKETRAHEKERASAWRSKLDEKDDESVNKDEKRYLNPAQKKKIAFINQEFHSSAGTVNAYIVFAHPPSTEGRPANLPPLLPTMDPYQAAISAAEKCDGTIFMERMLRVDLVSKNTTTTPSTAIDAAVAKPSILETDPRLSVFIGNLDFASKEEDLRVFFEGVVSAERGPPPISSDAEDNGEVVSDPKKPSTWVTRVRIVRDKDSQLGKGFAYVQFVDRECVDELLALTEDKLKFAKRKLRVQRCKTAPGTKQVITQRKEKGPAVVIPKGDPALGERLAGLPKDERKQLKSTDADRVARRLAKKKARMSMAPRVGKSNPSKGKNRKRVR